MPHIRPYALVDFGSNKSKILIGVYKGNGRLQKIAEYQVDGQLADGLSARQDFPVIKDLHIQCVLQGVHRFRTLINKHEVPPENVLAFGTEALRIVSKKNPTQAHQFLSAIRENLHHPVNVITGVEEARLMGFAARMDCLWKKRPYKRMSINNIGGGSSQQSIVDLSKTGADIINNPSSFSQGLLTIKQEHGNNVKRAGEAYLEMLREQFPHPDTQVSALLGASWGPLRMALKCERDTDTVKGASHIADVLYWGKNLSDKAYRLYGGKEGDRAENMYLTVALLEAFVKHTKPEVLIFMKRSMRDAGIEIMHQVSSGAATPQSFGLERLFSPSIPSPSCRV